MIKCKYARLRYVKFIILKAALKVGHAAPGPFVSEISVQEPQQAANLCRCN